MLKRSICSKGVLNKNGSHWGNAQYVRSNLDYEGGSRGSKKDVVPNAQPALSPTPTFHPDPVLQPGRALRHALPQPLSPPDPLWTPNAKRAVCHDRPRPPL
eukprot:2546478-Amphidinium_carterae.1